MDKLEREDTRVSVVTDKSSATPKTAKPAATGLSIPATFCPDDGTDPFATLD